MRPRHLGKDQNDKTSKSVSRNQHGTSGGKEKQEALSLYQEEMEIEFSIGGELPYLVTPGGRRVRTRSAFQRELLQIQSLQLSSSVKRTSSLTSEFAETSGSWSWHVCLEGASALSIVQSTRTATLENVPADHLIKMTVEESRESKIMNSSIV